MRAPSRRGRSHLCLASQSDGETQTRTARLRSLSRRLAPEGVVRNNAIFFVGSVVAGAFGYAFHFVVGRLLGPAAYSVGASAAAAGYLLTLTSLVLQLIRGRL